MIARLSESIVSWQIGKGILDDGERALYQYAYEVLLNQTINVLIAILIAVAFRSPVPVLVFLLCYIPLRSFCGGYHSRTHERCTVASAILICLVCVLARRFAAGSTMALMALSALVSGGAVFSLAPVPDENKPLDEAETARYRKVGRAIWLVEAAIGFALFPIWREAGFVVAVSHLIFSAMLFLGSVKNRKASSPIIKEHG